MLQALSAGESPEIGALTAAQGDLADATLYVTLIPGTMVRESRNCAPPGLMFGWALWKRRHAPTSAVT
jgi:hypothetical protein